MGVRHPETVANLKMIPDRPSQYLKEDLPLDIETQ